MNAYKVTLGAKINTYQSLALLPLIALESWVLVNFVAFLRKSEIPKSQPANQIFSVYVVRSITCAILSIFVYSVLWVVGLIASATLLPVGINIYFWFVVLNFVMLALLTAKYRHFLAVEKKQFLFTFLTKGLQLGILSFLYLALQVG